MNQQKTKGQFDPNQMRRKSLLVQKFINFLLVVRLYLTEVPLWMWSVFLILIFLLKTKRQGNIPTSLITIIAILFSIVGQYFQIHFLYLAAPLLGGISHFFYYKIYWFPKVTAPIGMKEEILQNDIYQMELYPIKKNQNTKKRVIFWNHRLEFNKMLQHQKANNPIFKIIYKFFISAVLKAKLILATGDQQQTNQSIVFSHGRTATPLMYSQLLIKITSLQSVRYKIAAVQHTEKMETGQNQIKKIKKFRQIQVQARAAQMYSSIQHCKHAKKIVLMGHSYGGATTVQTYLSLPEDLKNKVSHLVLLDPWLFPLTEAKLIHQIKCPILVLANEYFIENEQVYEKNKQFINAHKSGKLIYLVWKKGDHLHQTDMGFLIGNILNTVKHSDLSLEMLNKNVEAIRMFLQDSKMTQGKMREIFQADILPENYKPQKWNNYLTL